MPFLEEMYANRWYSNFGPLVVRFEQEMASFLRLEETGKKLSVQTFSSATAALEIALRALGLPAGAKVLVPALTFPATALAVLNAGLTPVLADVSAEDWMLEPATAYRALEILQIAAVIPVAAFGYPVPVQPWETFQADTDIPVLLDAAAALGQQDISPDLIHVFSLHATKPFGVGEGGLLVAADRNLMVKSKSLSNFGFLGPGGVVQQAGTNAKMSEYFAAVGLAQLKRWQKVLERRRNVAGHYLEKLQLLDNAILFQGNLEQHIPAVFPVYVRSGAERLIENLESAGIQTRRWYLPPLYEHPALSGLDYIPSADGKAFPVCEDLKVKLVGLPFHGFLTEKNVHMISDIVAREVL